MTQQKIREELLALRERLARLEARHEADAPHQEQAREDLRQIRDALLEVRGSARVVALVAAGVGAVVGSGISALLGWLIP